MSDVSLTSPPHEGEPAGLEADELKTVIVLILLEESGRGREEVLH